MNPIETYLSEIRYIRSTGAATAETSYYTPLANLLNEIGKTLKPHVRCIMQPTNHGAGFPDGGLFTAEQYKRARNKDQEPLLGQMPERGVIEVKPVSDDAWVTAAGPQVVRYWERYQQVLVTNLRDYVLIGADAEGNATQVESYSLADSEAAFLEAVARPRKTAEAHGERFSEFLKRVMLHAAPLGKPEDVAWFLASYARDARVRIEHSELADLSPIRDALEEALGMKFEGEKAEHFFRSTLVQTLFYGVFSAWVLWAKSHPDPGARFDWRTSAHYLHVPVVRKLFHEMADPGPLEALGLSEVLDVAGAVLNRVARGSFFTNFEEGQAVIYFYEPFLKAFDPDLRKELGVWYTPPEIVKYMVARVDTVLKDELDLEDGLADPSVLILDPCCGTGAYLVEALKLIHARLIENGADALVGQDVKRAALDRVFGFEILPAPFVVAHLQLGLLLQNLGAPLLEEKDERASIFLTNSLTGWKEREQHALGWSELEAERAASDFVKRDKQILVVLGNPPYNAFAGVSPAEEEGLVEIYKGIYYQQKRPYKRGKRSIQPPPTRRYRLSDPVSMGGWGIKKFNLDDLYVRFFRLAERRIAEMTGRGVICYISNFSYLSDPSFVMMRERFLSEFDRIWIDCMNGDSRETGKLTPDGRPDPSVFSTELNREGIKVGTAIAVMARTAVRSDQPVVLFRNQWGVSKRADLLNSLEDTGFAHSYEAAAPSRDNRYSFRPGATSSHYSRWPRLTDLAAEPPMNGLMEKRGGALIDVDRDALASRMQMYYDKDCPWARLAALGTGLTRDAAGFDAQAARRKITESGAYDARNVVRYAVRPMDMRWAYYSDVSPLWNRSRPDLWFQYVHGNQFLMSRPAGVASPEGVPMFYTRALGDNDFLRGHAYYIPFAIHERLARALVGFSDESAQEPAAIVRPNLSAPARAYLTAIGVTAVDGDVEEASLLWWHALAIGFSQAYQEANADGIRQDWPRVPLPATGETLRASAALGRELAGLLDTEMSVDGVTAGALKPELRCVAVLTAADGSAADLRVTAGWGHAGQERATMPGRGHTMERPYEPEETSALGPAAIQLGNTTTNVYLNETTYWKNVPSGVWAFTVGGYPVIKKWLSYRESDILGRALTPDEVREVTGIARRVAAILLLQPHLDANYGAVSADTYSWPGTAAEQ